MARKRRRKLKKGPVLILFLIIFLVIFSVYKIYTNTSKYLFFKGIGQSSTVLFDLYDDVKGKYIPYLNSNYLNKTNTLVELETNEQKNSISFIGDIYLNDKSNYFDLNIKANTSDYGLELLSKDNKIYFKIDDSKYYCTDYNNDNYDLEIYFELIKLFYEAIADNTSNSNFIKQDVSLKINSKEYNTKKVSLVFDQKLYDNIIDSFINKISNEEKYLSLFNVNKKEELYEKFALKLDDKITYSIYLYNSKCIRHELEEYVLHYSYVDNYFEIVKDKSYINLKDNNISLFVDGLLYGNGKYDDKSFSINFTDYNSNSLGDINYSISGKNEKYNYDFDMIINLELIKFSMSSDNEINVNKKVSIPNLNDSVSIENITSNDKKLMDELLSFINDIIDF